MSLNIGEHGREQLVVAETTDGSFTDYILELEGRLNGATAKAHRLKYRSFTDGILCNDFGQGVVAVRGFTTNAKPVLFTSSGVLEITNNAIQVGCPDCVKLFNKEDGDLVVSTLTPAWDLSLAGYRDGKVSYTNNGDLYLWTQERCTSFSESALFHSLESDLCIEPDDFVLHTQNTYGIEQTPEEWLMDIVGNKHVAFIKRGACT